MNSPAHNRPSSPAERVEATPTAVQSSLQSLEIRPRPRWISWVMGGIVVFLVAGFIYDVAVNPNFKWQIVAQHLFNWDILRGVQITLLLTAVSMVLGILLGVILAVMRLSTNPTLSWVARGYIWFFRGTPLLVQLIFWYNIAALYPLVSLGLPFGDLSIPLGTANTLITPMTAAILGLSLNEAAYMAEIIRSGILSVDEGQRDAGKAIGMSSFLLMTRVILPQAMRVVIPPTGNQVISMLKSTSLVSVIAISDLLYSAQIIYSLNYQTIPLLIVTCVWYLLMTTVLSFFQGKLEERYGRGFQPRSKPQRRGKKTATAATGAATETAN